MFSAGVYFEATTFALNHKILGLRTSPSIDDYAEDGGSGAF